MQTPDSITSRQCYAYAATCWTTTIASAIAALGSTYCRFRWESASVELHRLMNVLVSIVKLTVMLRWNRLRAS